MRNIVAFAFLMTVLVACASPTTPGLQATHSPNPLPSATPTPHETNSPPPADIKPTPAPQEPIVLRPEQAGQIIAVQVGQTLFIANPDGSMKWQIDYAAEILQAVELSEIEVQQNGPGWKFLAIAPGQTDLAVNGLPDCSNPPCPPAALRIVFTIEVKP